MTRYCFLGLVVLNLLPLTHALSNDIVARAISSSSSTSTVSVPPSTRSHPTSLPHSSYNGTATVTGALTASSIGTGIPSGNVSYTATTYPSDGNLQNAEPAPYVPAGGVGTNGSIPVYNAKSDFDYESLALALYQEWIELDLFQDGLRRFSAKDFKAAGLSSKERDLIAFMAEQEVGHATLISNILGANAPQQCAYVYPYTNVSEFIDFAQKVTRSGEAGVYGFLAHLDSREAATLLTQSISVEARQQVIFRQFQGLFPMPEWFEVGIPQSWAWTLLAPYISWCPENQTRLVWENFPALKILDQPSLTDQQSGQNTSTTQNNTISPGTNVVKASQGKNASSSARQNITTENIPSLSYPGREVVLHWDNPGKAVGPNNSYVTTSQAKTAQYVVWVSQLNVTYSSLTSVNGTWGHTFQPDLETYQGDPAVNGTIFIAITDSNPVLSPSNLSSINPHIVAGPAIYQAG
ncbi:Protein rds1 [Penicillium odoratum]|uniref:Protein rds1 n=1 Tax=Penicillium odoratum TaxID=1167516 RepID=UPI002547BA34|nr:Protein rds1 [Penicillium odoratum]KAJ5746008.1 Protein rds1 [Penicillium odoratum]